jgi:ABC-2 type transport system ATP-binding protein
MIHVQNLNKCYKNTTALKDISFEVKKNELFGFIGPDGAGKTTLFRILATLLLADNGAASINGWDVQKDYRHIRENIGYMPGKFSLYQDLTVEENLTFFATIFGTTIGENYHLIKDIYSQIEPFKTRKAGALSGGMKQKLALSCALIHKPELLILDEPTTGVDAVSRKEFWEMLKNLCGMGITILVSTPYMDEASLCNRVALVQNGSILTVDSPENITNQYNEPLWAIRSNNIYQLMKDLKKFKSYNSAYLFGQYVHYTDSDKENIGLNELKAFLTGMGHQNLEVLSIQPSIEDCFMKLMIKQV